jgi:hypothetical protein
MRIAGRSAQRARLACASLSMLLVLASPLFAQGQRGGGQRGQGQRGQGANPQAPAAQHPPALQNDLFTSKNFYKDKALWSDPRYFRCNSPRQLTDMWTRGGRIGNDPPRSAEWGDCNADYPADNIKSKLPYKTAKEHYEALLAQAKAAGGPTIHTRQTLPDWDGRYNRAGNDPQWLYGRINQVPTILSLLTPDYQQRMVQMNYHEAVDNAPQWNAAYCYPEGFMRWWAEFSIGQIEIMTTPAQVQFLSGVADNFLRRVLVGRNHVQQVPQWWGETVGFWRGDTLISWTANVQGWTLSHSMFEYSNSLETVEVFTPRRNADGTFAGLTVDTTFYDPEAFVAPLHAVQQWNRVAALENPTQRYTYIECLSNIKSLNGKPTQLTQGDPGYIDFYGRPWAQNWEKLEVGWDKPELELPGIFGKQK